MIQIDLQYFGGNGSASGKGSGKLPSSTMRPNQTKTQQDIVNMSDSEFCEYLDKLLYDTEVPDGYYKKIDLQKMIIDAGMEEKPTVLSEEDFNKYVAETGQQIMYRGVHGNPGIITAEDIQNDYRYGENFHIGGGIYGDGLYSTTEFYQAFGHYSDKTSGSVSKFVLSSKAKIIDYNELNYYRAYKLDKETKRRLSKSGDKSSFGNMGESQLAIRLGYNVIKRDVGSGRCHYIVLDRSAMVMSEEAAY